ncbi:MAG: SpoIIE family protein phosphatase [Spirochaetales bacterium]|nr:SpoIIE family protein phosphatase [Spirochaetales bacterium]
MIQKKSVFIISFFLGFSPLFLAAQDFNWEDPSLLVTSNARFIQAESGGGMIALVWQEFEYKNKLGFIYLTLWTTRDMKRWKKNNRFAGPFPFSEKEIQIFSLAVTNKGNIYIAVTVSENKTTLFYSEDEGQSFVTTSITSLQPALSPEIFIRENEEFMLFVTHAISDIDISLYYLSLDNSVFSSRNYTGQFRLFVTPDDALGVNFLPSYCYVKGTEYVVFQARKKGEKTGYQLYLKMSNTRGNTWTTSKLLTDFSEVIDGKEVSQSLFDNQRPFINTIGNRIYITWERKMGLQNTQIHLAEIDTYGILVSEKRITDNKYTSFSPRIFSFNYNTYLLWSDDPGNNRIRIAEQKGSEWIMEKSDLSYSIPGDSRFPSPVQIKNFLYIFWENKYRDSSRLVFLQPDQFVDMPKIYTKDFSPGKPGNEKRIIVNWSIPRDASGISHFLYIWSNKAYASRAEMKEVTNDTTKDTFVVPGDGTWYFHLQAADYAGNYSATTSVSYILDTKAPDPVTFREQETDAEGFLVSNTFTLSWIPPEDNDVAGYSYELERINTRLAVDISSLDPGQMKRPGGAIKGFQTERSYRNYDNGVYGFSVRAIDHVGNPGEVASIYFKLNKYIPVTIVNSIYSSLNPENEVVWRITGRGFFANGKVSRIFIDRDAQKPYDYTFTLDENAYTIRDDRTIDNLVLDLDEDIYRLVIEHETRGLYVYRGRIEYKSPGTIIMLPENYEPYKPDWKKFYSPVLSIRINELFIWLLVILFGLLFIVSMKKVAGVYREGLMLEAEVHAVMSGKERKIKKIKRISRLKTKGLGLRIKFAFLITILVLLVILMLSITLSFYMIQTQRQNLTDGLLKQVEVLLGSLAAGAEVSLPRQDQGELISLPDQSKAMEEALHATITGISKFGSRFPDEYEYVWGTNNPDIGFLIDTEEYEQGISILTDDISRLTGEIREKVNKQATDEVAEEAHLVDQLINEKIALMRKTDQQSKQTIDEIDRALEEKQPAIKEKLKTISSKFKGSVPKFSPEEKIEEMYTFYRPIVYRLPGEDIYFRGMVRVALSTEKMLSIITSSTNELLVRIFVISLIAIGLGIIGAIFLASITISPIKKLARFVAKIRDTEDKSDLINVTIDIKRKDEIGLLSDNILQMKDGLARAEVARKDLIVGKEIQKMFIPLEEGAQGKKGSTGAEINENVEFFGYYEGAKGVSGDYFDFRKLDNEYYAIIKCDVAGKGVPAALIMVEVATIFNDYFHDWSLKTHGIKINELVYKINDTLIEREFKGRFAALIIILYNMKTGAGYFCNAGDNVQHLYSVKTRKMAQFKLPEAPAAGVFATDLIQMQSGFQQIAKKFHKGDILFLFSDGFDESKRLFRNSKFEKIVCDEPSLKIGEVHNETHKKGDEGEEFSIKRLYAIIEAVIHKSTYNLVKHHNPDEEITFDFSTLNGNVHDIIMALVSVEKIFRLYKNPAATIDDWVIVDAKVDEFLKEHFMQYGYYFNKRIELSKKPEYEGYVGFAYLNEDEQYDDLTILGIAKK